MDDETQYVTHGPKQKCARFLNFYHEQLESFTRMGIKKKKTFVFLQKKGFFTTI